MCDRFEIRTLGGTSREGVGGKEGGGGRVGEVTRTGVPFEDFFYKRNA